MYIKEYFPPVLCYLLPTPNSSLLSLDCVHEFWFCSVTHLILRGPTGFCFLSVSFWNSLQAVQRCYKCLIIRAAPSSVTHSQHLGQLWVSTLPPSTGQRGFSDWGCDKLLHVTTFCCTVLNQTSERWGDNPWRCTIMKQQKMPSSFAYPKGW